ncbi:YqaA family protein [Shewanella litorisediminis]|uniref:DedA family protein n=1 Tax=Shewanella litorisediminis TaxID=1173586 RepID=A0ABX7G6G9_9GAMM|nr:YqaA family protein [Shewanella litorisediminis]MCL2917677.1 DedA family protein [Shewanella litorisediminis]QRH02798.1 DedA family protein [Shewanella litorisediminis]
MEPLWLMFSGAFLAATLLPGGSEVLLLALVNSSPELWFSLFVVATLGNTLGALTSLGLGRLGRVAWEPEQLSRSQRRALALVEKYGVWSLLLSWAPVIGDILCVLAGWLRLPLVMSIILILIGKGARYGLLLLMMQAF